MKWYLSGNRRRTSFPYYSNFYLTRVNKSFFYFCGDISCQACSFNVGNSSWVNKYSHFSTCLYSESFINSIVRICYCFQCFETLNVLLCRFTPCTWTTTRYCISTDNNKRFNTFWSNFFMVRCYAMYNFISNSKSFCEVRSNECMSSLHFSINCFTYVM